MGRGREILARAGLLLASTLLCVAVFECGLRLAYTGSVRRLSGEHVLRVPHPVRGWTLAPDAEAFQRTRDYAVLVRTNARGQRGPLREPEPAPGVRRVVILGDSFMEAYQVPYEDALPSVLERELAPRRVETVNLGVGGYGTAQELLALRDEGLAYRPRVVVLAFFAGNDIHNNSRALQTLLWGEGDLKVVGRPYARAESLSAPLRWDLPDPERLQEIFAERRARRRGALRRAVRFLEPTLLAGAVERALATLGPSAGFGGYDPNVLFGWPFQTAFAAEHAAPGLSAARYERVWADAWRVTRRLLLAADELARSRGARLVVLMVPSRMQVEPARLEQVRERYPGLPLAPWRVNRELRRFCEAHGIPFLDPTPEFRRVHAREGRRLFHHLEDQHWNAAGHALAARRLAAFLRSEGLLRSPPARAASGGGP